MRLILSVLWVCVMTGCMAQKTPTSPSDVWDRMLVYQLPNGGWPKHYTDGAAVDYSKPINSSLKSKIATDGIYATIDNHATTREIEALAEGFQKTSKRQYKEAVVKGINYLLSAQYENGGFPQYFPDTRNYRSQITFNDNAMINVLTLLREVGSESDLYNFIDVDLRERAQQAVEKGIDCILRAQVVANGQLTIWAAQYDENLKPAQARKFEPVSLTSSESVGIVRFLMKEKPTQQIILAIESAIKWFENNKIEGYRFDAVKKSNGKMERKLVPDAGSVVWSRFYEIGTNKPIFGDRDDTVHYNFDEISEERKNGYAWFGEWPLNLINNNYPKWLKSIQSNK